MIAVPIIILAIVSRSSCQMPMDSFYSPYPGITRIFVSPKIAGFPMTLSYNFVYSSTYTTIPFVFASIVKFQWSGQIKLDYSFQSINLTSCVLVINDYANTVTDYIINLNLQVVAYNSGYFAVNSQQFNFFQPGNTFIVQNITVPNHLNFQASILTQYQQYIDYSIFTGVSTAPYAFITKISSSSKSISIINDCQCGYLIKKLRFVMVGIALLNVNLGYFATKYFDLINTQSVTTSVNGYVFITSKQTSAYSAAHFYGINFIYDIQTTNTKIGFIDISNNTNCFAYYFSLAFYIQRCPIGYPYQLIDSGQCYMTCPNNSYHIPGDPLLNNYFLCKLCNTICASCVNNPDNCSSCVGGAILYQPNISSNTFACKCPIGYLGSPYTNCSHCNATMPYCLQCTNSSYCTKCEPSSVFSISRMTCQCPPNLIPVPIVINYIVNEMGTGIGKTTLRLKCISSRVFSQTCDDNIVKRISGTSIINNNTSLIIPGLSIFGQRCQCNQGRAYVDNKCL